MLPKLNPQWSPEKKLESLLGLVECVAAQLREKKTAAMDGFSRQFGV